MWEVWKNVVQRDMANGILRKRKCPIMVDGSITLLLGMDDIVTLGWKIGQMVGLGLFPMMRRGVIPNILMREGLRRDISMDMESWLSEIRAGMRGLGRMADVGDMESILRITGVLWSSNLRELSRSQNQRKKNRKRRSLHRSFTSKDNLNNYFNQLLFNLLQPPNQS
jgi:hypothetical protein